MKNPLTLALTLALLTTGCAVAADVNADIHTDAIAPGINAGASLNAELKQDKKVEHQSSHSTEVKTEKTEVRQSSQTDDDSEPENKSENLDSAPLKTSNKDSEVVKISETAQANEMNGKAEAAEVEVSQQKSSKHVQKLFNKFQKENQPQTEANAHSETKMESHTTKTETTVK